MPSPPTRRSLEELFELPEDYLHRPIAEALRPGLIEATERSTDRDRILKIWPKTGTEADLELRELWRHERLQVDRIMSYPGADEVMSGVVDMVETSDSFCIIHEPGAVPLAAKLRTIKDQHWLRSLDAPANRIILWRNFARLSRALGIIHSQGLIHGRIDAFAVFTEGQLSPDFRLGGFEWSLVLAEPQPMPLSLQQIRARIERLIYSYAEDWKSLGVLFADLLGLDAERLREDDPFRNGVKLIEIDDSEIDFLRRLIDPARGEILEAKAILRDAEGLADQLGRFGETHAGRLLLMFRPNQVMAEAIYKATGGAIEIEDDTTQALFVEGDLATGARLAAAERRELDHFFLLTESLSYRVQPYTDDGSPSWQIGVITSIVPRTEARLPPTREVYAVRHPVELLRNKAEATKRLGQLGSGALDWTLVTAPLTEPTRDAETVTLGQAMLLIQVLEALLRSLEVLPVAIVKWRSIEGRTIAQIVPRESTSRDQIAAAIGERSTAEIMDRLFDKDDVGVDVDWVLSTSGGLSSQTQAESPARFRSVERGDDGRVVYEFGMFDVPSDADTLFLRRKGDKGTESLIKRKLRTTQVLDDQRDLITMFVDPRRRLKSSGETIDKDNFFYALDVPKQQALEGLWTTVPSYFVLGPPGVGKTRLVTEVVRRKLAGEPATRMLISAQSHQALDNILRAVKKGLGTAADVIMVRSRGNEDAVSTDADVRRIALDYLDRILGSGPVDEAPPNFRQALDALRDACERADTEQEAGSRREAEGIRALKSLVLESANLVFSTSTSLDVERLMEDGAQFEWVVIEEAAKASGPELVAPLSLSRRRLLIGDHFQLPPFGSERIKELLASKTTIRNALTQADSAIGSTFFEMGLDELRVSLEDESTLDNVIQAARRALEPFATLVEEDKARRAVAGGLRRSVSSELLVQHRMDPAIAYLVSHCFYGGRLETSSKRVKESAEPLPFSFSGDFPTSPVVFVNTPFVSRTGRAKPVESGRPRWHNPTEAKIILNLISRLHISPSGPGETPTLAVLSPYRAQNERIARQIEALRTRGGYSFTALDGFTHDGRICGTVDSSQGSEADLVIVGLVRNNHQTGAPALGFLRDPRRMNVLLSRARKQLIIVGSLEFLKESTRHVAPADELGFVRKFIEVIDYLTSQETLRGVPAATVIDALTLGGTAA